MTDLRAAHEYHTDTLAAWSVANDYFASGGLVTIENAVTKTITTQVELAARARDYLAVQVPEATFQQFLSIFEGFYLDFVRLWLTAYPQSLGSKTVDFKTVLDLPDKDAVVRAVVAKELNEVLYGRLADWFAYLEKKAKLGCPSPDEIERLAEAKATRDLLVHNGGIANRVYLDKAGKLARFQDGERIDIPDRYHRETWELLYKIVTDLTNAAVAKKDRVPR